MRIEMKKRKNFFDMVCDMSRDEMIDVIMLLAAFVTLPSDKIEKRLDGVDLSESTMIVTREIVNWFVDMVSKPETKDLDIQFCNDKPSVVFDRYYRQHGLD